MNWLNWLLLATTIIFFALALFLGREMLRKFRQHILFTSSPGYISKWIYSWPGGAKPKMRNMVLKGKKPFKVLVGFELVIPLLRFRGIDWYGFVEAEKQTNGDYLTVISTFMWKKPVEFPLLVNAEQKDDVELLPVADGQSLAPHLICPPHLYQRLGFYA